MLHLDSQKRNDRFTSWRLAKCFSWNSVSIPLPGPSVAEAHSTGGPASFLHAREAVLHNHLRHSGGRLFTLTRSPSAGGAVQLLEVQSMQASAQAAATLSVLAKLSTPADAPRLMEAAEAPAKCSVAVVSPQHECPTGAAGAAATTAGSAAAILVASLGRGDVRVLWQQADGSVVQSAVAYPLRPAAPLAGACPFFIEAAYTSGAGSICCIVWAAVGKQDGVPACCEVFALDLLCSDPAVAAGAAACGGHTPQLTCGVVTLLKRSRLPPHLVMPAPQGAAGGSVLVGLDTLDEDDQDDAVHLDCSAAPRGGATASAPYDDDAMDMDPRTLEAAAARLAAYSSDQPAPSLTDQRWADIYKEAGSDGAGALGGEPTCDLRVFAGPLGGGRGGAAAAGAAAAAEAEQGAAGTSQQEGPLASGPRTGRGPPPASARSLAVGAVSRALEARWQLSCGMNNLLTAGEVVPDGAGGTSVLLGVSDDVDCAVVRVAWRSGCAEPQAEHLLNVPALAYVVAGKQQKRHLLLGAAGSWLAAVLVEGHKYLYIYRAPGATDEYGQQQVVDMELEADELVVGAQLLPMAGDAGQHQLLLLTQRRLLVHVLCP